MMSVVRFSAAALAAAAVTACTVLPINGDAMEALTVQEDGQQSASAPQLPAQEPAALEKAAQTYTAMADPKSKAYKIGPLDVLDITVFKVPELSKSVQVSDIGTINFPLIGQIQAGGKSARELEQELTTKLGAKYLRSPQITVFVKDYNSQRVTIAGAVKKPGVVTIAGGMTLMQAIAQSGGLDKVAESKATIFRGSEGKRIGQPYDLSDLDAGRGNDPQLQSGDVIVVPVSNIKYGTSMVLKMVPLAALLPCSNCVSPRQVQTRKR